MFEFDKYQRTLHTEAPAVPTSEYTPVLNIEKTSLLIWDEHCVECGAPQCFQTCDLYQPRPDQRCRRFAFGIYKNRQFRSLHGYGAEVTFKKWGKLEARGNLFLEPLRTLSRKARLIELLMPFGNRFGSLMFTLTKDIRWSYVTHALLERWGRYLNTRPRVARPDAFLLEVYNPTPNAVRLQVTMSWTKAAGNWPIRPEFRPPFTSTVVCAAGYTRHEIDSLRFRDFLDSNQPFDVALIPEADTAAHLVFLAADFVKYRKSDALSRRPKVKCVVWDLDHTLWEGILIESEDVRVNPKALEVIKELDSRGILSSIASKNDAGSAWKKLEQLGIAEYFLFPQINWNPKSESIKIIAKRLSVGLDTLAFVDDSPFELDQVSSVLPEVACVKAQDIEGLLKDPQFAGSHSEDAKNRRLYYRQAIDREEKQAAFGDDYVGFLAACEISLSIRPYSDADLERVAELVQRTNQLNFSGSKYDREGVQRLISDPGLEKLVLTCSDRYGSYGTIGFAVIRQGVGEVRMEDLMLSCRVQAKNIEQALLGHLTLHHNPSAATRIFVNFRETARNAPARNVLESLRFQRDPSGKGMSRSFQPDELACDYIIVNCSASGCQSTSITVQMNTPDVDHSGG